MDNLQPKKKKGCLTYLIIGISLSVLWNFVMSDFLGFQRIGWFKALMLYIGVGVILEIRDKYNNH